MAEPVLVPLEPIYGAASMQPVSYIVALGLMCSLALAAAMGANDVANAFGTSVGAGVLTVRQACVIAGVFSFTGALALGASVAATIAGSIVNVNDFTTAPAIYMVGMLSALVASALCVGLATRFALPISTTHAIVASVVGFALVEGRGGVKWWPGVGKIFISWVASPALAGLLSAGMYALTRRTVLRNQTNPLLMQRRLVSGVISGVGVLLTLTVGYKFLSVDGSDWEWGVAVLGLGVLLLGFPACHYWLVPLLFSSIRMGDGGGGVDGALIDDGTGGHHGSAGAHDLLLAESYKSSAGASSAASQIAAGMQGRGNAIKDTGEAGNKDLVESRDKSVMLPAAEGESANAGSSVGEKDLPGCEAQQETRLTIRSYGGVDGRSYNSHAKEHAAPPLEVSQKESSLVAKEYSYDDITAEELGAEDSTISRKTAKTSQLHARAERFSGRLEANFKAVQVLTACYMSFSHGASDVSNAAGPVVAILNVYEDGRVEESVRIEYWVIAVTGLAIVAGLLLFGERVMATIGTHITLVTPSRGYCIELGTATAVLIASFIGVPVSTTQCAIGSVVCVGCLNPEGWRAVKWRLLGKVVGSWLLTLPLAGGISAGLFAAMRPLVVGVDPLPGATLVYCLPSDGGGSCTTAGGRS